MAKSNVAYSYSLKGKRIFVAGHTGMVGAALCRRLADEGCELLTSFHSDLDLRNQAATSRWMEQNKPDAVVIAAARVGGIGANKDNPASFFYDNMMIAANLIHSAHEACVDRLLFLGSSCIYPRDSVQPIKEGSLLSGALEPTNEAYALAKISGLKMVEYYRGQYGRDYISAMPCNLYGPGDTYDAYNSHVIPAMIMKFHTAKVSGADEAVLWGTGTPLREFLYVDDLAAGLVMMLQKYSDFQPVNIGSGEEITIKNLANIICEVVGFEGKIIFENSMPDGVPRKVLDNSRIMALGWQSEMWLKKGIEECYSDYLKGGAHESRENYYTSYSSRRAG